MNRRCPVRYPRRGTRAQRCCRGQAGNRSSGRPAAEPSRTCASWRAWRKAHTWDAGSQLSTWLFAIAYRQALKAVRRDRPAQELEDEPVAPTDAEPDGELEQHQLQRRLAVALGALTAEHRAVVELTY